MNNQVEIWLQTTSQPIVRNNVETYTKDGFYCVLNRGENSVEKYPIATIYKVKEAYSKKENCRPEV